MMRKWLTSTFIILFILALMPPLFGIIAKKSLQHLIDNLVLPEGVSLALVDYQFGYLDSKAAVNIQIENTPDRAHYIAGKELIISVHGDIAHGPLLLNANSLMVGLAKLNTYATMNDIQGLDPTLREELELLFTDKPVLHAMSLFKLNRDIDIDLTSSPVQVTADGDVLQWNGFDAYITIDSTFNHIKTEAIISPILFTTTQGTTLDTAQIHFSTTLSRKANQPWTGEQLLSIPAFYLQDTTGAILRFDHLRLISSSAIIDQLLNATLNVEVDNIDLSGELIDKLHLNIQFNNLMSSALFTLSQSIREANSTTLPYLLDLISKTLGQGADIYMDYRINTDHEQMLLSFMLDFPILDNKEINALLLGANAQIILNIPKDFMDKAIIIDTIGPHLNMLKKAGMLIEKNNVYHMEIDYHQGTFMLNHLPVPQEQIFGLIVLLLQGHSHASTTH